MKFLKQYTYFRHVIAKPLKFVQISRFLFTEKDLKKHYAFDNERGSLNFLKFLNNRHPNIKFTIEKKLTIPSPFLMYSFQVSTIKISHFKNITNRPIQDFS